MANIKDLPDSVKCEHCGSKNTELWKFNKSQDIATYECNDCGGYTEIEV